MIRYLQRPSVTEARVIRHVATRDRVAAFTFDDGPSAWTPRIAELFERHRGRATFFVLGEAIPGREHVLRELAGAGHEIGNHSHDHPRLTELGDDQIRTQIETTTKAIADVVGAPPRFWRPPYFDFDDRVRAAVASAGLFEMVHCTVATGDYDASVPLICARVLKGCGPGGIVDLHDGAPARDASPPSRERTVDALARLLPVLADDGYRFVTVGELLECAA